MVLAQRERTKTLKEMAQASRYFFEDVRLDPKAAAKHLGAEAGVLLRELGLRLRALADWRAAGVHEALTAVAAEKGLGLGKIAQPLRVAITGGTVSPPIDQTAELLGGEKTLARLAAVS